MEAVKDQNDLGMNMLTVVINTYKGGYEENLYGVIPKRFVAILGILRRWVLFGLGFWRWVGLDFDGETTDGEELGERERGVRERAFVEGKEEDFEIGKPGDEEGGGATEMHGVEIKREV